MKEQQITLAEGTKGLLTSLLIEKEEDSSALLKTLTKPVVVQPYEQYIKTSKNIYHTLIFNTIVSSIPLRRVEESDQIGAELAA